MSLATDLGTGLPLEHGLRTCLLATRLADAAQCEDGVRDAAWTVALLHSIGCTSDAHEAAALYGDDVAVRAAYALVDPGKPAELRRLPARDAGAGRAGPARAAAFAGRAGGGPAAPAGSFAQHCEVAERLAGRLGVGDARAARALVLLRALGRQGLPARRARRRDPAARRASLHVARDADALCAPPARTPPWPRWRDASRRRLRPGRSPLLCADGGRLAPRLARRRCGTR